MPTKTQRLAALLPEVYAARYGDGTLHRLLDAVGAELTGADTAVKRLLSSHWIDYAQGQGLDGLAATFNERRRILRDGTAETDEALRQRLKSLVARFTGGGTVAAVKGAVRSALGLPFDLKDLPLPPNAEELREAIDGLVDLTEFAPDPTSMRAPDSASQIEGNLRRLDVPVDLPSVRPELPVIQIRATLGVARNISVQLGDSDQGVRANPQLALQPGETLVLETDPQGRFLARVLSEAGQRSVGHLFLAWDSTSPPELPPVPGGSSTWVFRAGSGFAADQWAAFDEDTFDLPLFEAELTWTRYEPLTFDLTVPYFLKDAVQRLRDDYSYTGPVFAYEGLPLNRIQEVVDTTKAAGVRGRVNFALNLPQDGADRHEMSEQQTGVALLRRTEDANATEAVSVGSISAVALTHDQEESLRIGGIFDISPFDDSHQVFLD
ncbi:hypothetical protein SAMN05421678_12921 [Actinopolymorpha cephalotaxi]|uniref:Uncharacterized protein n=1 Tax=Actinopolymorpha cephalotaxi TaxID=504797 RepID=A0A1I3C5C3_9ACTN|nr:hypothetical protein [Actinopolymorpha cephalotaxi]NYH85410.1 hypothetical protein [Actinopolymorpha cephalotaxi]SFH69526.1 hypothetical protein SAMN05421678_12921 [Actinopolymorpha cephalotaxi]